MKETDNVEVADTYQLQRIADAMEEILRLVKADQAQSQAQREKDEEEN